MLASSPRIMLLFAACFGLIAVLSFVNGQPIRGLGAGLYAAGVALVQWRRPARGTPEFAALLALQGLGAVLFVSAVVADWF